MNRFLCCRTLLLLGFVAVVAPACEGEVAPPETGLILEVRRPAADQDPFADPQVAFVELTAEGPDITPDQVQIVQKYTPGMQIELPTVPFGTKRQIRVGLWPKNAQTGLPAAPMLASGRTVPLDLVAGGLAIKLLPYVTRVNEFANVVNEINQPSLTDARIGATAVSASDSAVIIIGGATPKESATDPFDPASYQAFSNVLLQYDVNLRAVGDLSATYNAFLKEGRAFHASALGNNGLIAIVGGYTMDETKKPKLTRSIEFFDPATKQIRTSMVADSNPNDDIDPNRLLFARTGHTVTRMFDQDNYFIIVGGRGDKPDAARTWEIWHPVNGIQAQGLLSRPRWNHTAIRLPEADGGFVMLVGGEGLDEQGNPMVHNTFEVLRYDTLGHVSRMGNKLVTCKFAGKNYNQPPGSPFGYDKCAALKGQPGHLTILWTPEVYPLLESVGRTLPGVVYVPHGSYHYIYVVGGFADAAKTKPIDRIDIFNIGTGGWVPNSLKLETARGAPQITASLVGSRRGQVLVAGGIDAIGRSISKAEVIYYPYCRTTKECRDYGWCTNFSEKAQCVAASEADCVASTGCKQFGWCALVGGRCISAVGATPAPPQLGSALQQWTAKNSLLGGTVLGLAVPLSTGHILIAGGTQAGSSGPLVANGSLHLWNPL